MLFVCFFPCRNSTACPSSRPGTLLYPSRKVRTGCRAAIGADGAPVLLAPLPPPGSAAAAEDVNPSDHNTTVRIAQPSQSFHRPPGAGLCGGYRADGGGKSCMSYARSAHGSLFRSFAPLVPSLRAARNPEWLLF